MKTTLLLVEDEAALADSLTTEFELEDYHVIWAQDGSVGFAFAANKLVVFGSADTSPAHGA